MAQQLKQMQSLTDDERRILQGLMVIATIRDNQKLFTDTGTVDVDSTIWFIHFISRPLRNQSRQSNIAEINRLFDEAFAWLDRLDETDSEMNKLLRKRLLDSITNAEKNMDRLGNTYEKDRTFCVHLEVLRDTIIDRLTVYRNRH